MADVDEELRRYAKAQCDRIAKRRGRLERDRARAERRADRLAVELDRLAVEEREWAERAEGGD